MAGTGKPASTGKPAPEDHAQVELFIAYYNSARGEILQRIGQRDTALFLYLASAASIFGVAINEHDSALLFVLPLLGLGASHVHSNHSNIIGAIGMYLSVEAQEWANGRFRNGPVQWDGSRTLLSLRSSPVLAVLTSGMTLILLPSVIALAIAATEHHSSAAYGLAIAVGVVAVGLTCYLLVTSLRTRMRLNAAVRAHVQGTAGTPD